MAWAILIVDDSAFVRQALREFFKRELDFEVCGQAGNGREAIEKAQQLHPDLIVLDLSMPVMNGLDAAKVLRQIMPKIPLIMYSSFVDGLTERQATLMGVSEVVSKSERVSVLIDRARNPLNSMAA
jgi:DNA-binding NarL/FixJ family response regulator